MKLLQMQLEKWSGQYGRLGVSQGWCLDVILLDVFFLGVDSPHQKVQSCSGKYVHVIQFWRPLFGLIEKLWSRVGKFIVSCQVRHGERRQSVGVRQTTPPCARRGPGRGTAASPTVLWWEGLTVPKVGRAVAQG